MREADGGQRALLALCWPLLTLLPLPLQPPLTVDESVQGMLKVLSSLSEKDTGTFLSWEGKVIPW